MAQVVVKNRSAIPFSERETFVVEGVGGERSERWSL